MVILSDLIVQGISQRQAPLPNATKNKNTKQGQLILIVNLYPEAPEPCPPSGSRLSTLPWTRNNFLFVSIEGTRVKACWRASSRPLIYAL